MFLYRIIYVDDRLIQDYFASKGFYLLETP
jgi:hypothetical protein